MNVGLFRQVCNLADQLRPMASHLDKAQLDSTNLADAYAIFISLQTELLLASRQAAVQKWLNQAILPCHAVTYLLHPRYHGQGIEPDHAEKAREWLGIRDPDVPAAINFQVESLPYPQSFFHPADRSM